MVSTFACGWFPRSQGYADVKVHPSGRLSIDAEAEPLSLLIPVIAKIGHLNVMMDDSIQGNASLQLHNIGTREALDVLCRMYGMSMQPYPGNIWMLTSRESGRQRGLYNANTEVVHVHHASAAWLSVFLNEALFSSGNQQQGTAPVGHAVIKANERNNTLVLSGTSDEISLVKSMLKELDIPRERRVYQLSYAQAVNVSNQIQAAIFGTRSVGANNDITSSMTISEEMDVVVEGAGANEIITGTSGGGGGGGGQGGAQGGGGAGGGAGGGGGAEQSAMRQANITTRTNTLATVDYEVNTLGPVVLPNGKMNTVTVVATPSQLAQVEELLPMLDAKPPQVSVRADLVEVSSTALKELGFKLDYSEGSSPWSVALGALTPGLTNNVSFFENSNNPNVMNLQIQALIQNGKAKSIASPTIVASHDSETVINITDQILRGQQFSTAGENSFFGETTPLLGQAGITLDILPKIGANGTVTLRVRPMVTSVYNSVSSGTSTIELVRSRDMVAQAVALQDGQSMVIGGLIDTRGSSTEQKVPGLGDLPVIGAMFRASRKSSTRSELLIIVTPHILNQLEPTPIHRIDRTAETARRASLQPPVHNSF